MSALTMPAVAAPRVAVRSRTARRTEFGAVFLISWAGFFALGLFILSRHMVYADAESRLTHTYMVLWNQPAKLASIGFVWPPFQSLALLPFVVIKPLATSLIAIPLYSSLWSALLIASLNRTLTLFGLAPGWRAVLLLAACANPLMLDYATNGMAEIQFLTLMALGMHYFLAWWIGGARSYRQISLAGLLMGAAFMTRFEIGAWIALMTAGIAFKVWPHRRRLADVEAPILLFLAPTVYMAAVWAMISMLIVGGGPLSWLTRAGNQGYLGFKLQESTAHLTMDTIRVTADVSPALFVIPVLLLVVSAIRRDALGVLIALAATMGFLITLALLLHQPTLSLLQPRYNIRSLSMLVLAAGWLLRITPAGWWRAGVAAVAIAALLSAAVTANHLMLDGPHGEERAWERALTTGKNQDHTTAPPGYGIGTDDNRWMANYIDAHTRTPKSVLIDDATFPGVILLSGRPALFSTLVDNGQTAWEQTMVHPWGRFRYMVVGNRDETNSGFAVDLIMTHFHEAYTGLLPGTRVIHRDRYAALLAVSAQTPFPYRIAPVLAELRRHPLPGPPK